MLFRSLRRKCREEALNISHGDDLFNTTPINRDENKTGGRRNSRKFPIQINIVESVIYGSGNIAGYWDQPSC